MPRSAMAAVMLAWFASAAATPTIERRLYVTNKTGISVYDVADTNANRILGKIGPFSKGIRPFAVTDDEKYVYANVDGLLGFEIAEIQKNPWRGRMIHRVEAHTPASRLADIHEPPARKPHSTPSHGINLRPDQKEVWMVDGVYGYVYAFDVTTLPPRQIGSVPLFQDPKERPHPGWITFGIDGRYVYPDGGVVIDTQTKQVVARIPTSENSSRSTSSGASRCGRVTGEPRTAVTAVAGDGSPMEPLGRYKEGEDRPPSVRRYNPFEDL